MELKWEAHMYPTHTPNIFWTTGPVIGEDSLLSGNLPVHRCSHLPGLVLSGDDDRKKRTNNRGALPLSLSCYPDPHPPSKHEHTLTHTLSHSWDEKEKAFLGVFSVYAWDTLLEIGLLFHLGWEIRRKEREKNKIKSGDSTKVLVIWVLISFSNLSVTTYFLSPQVAATHAFCPRF